MRWLLGCACVLMLGCGTDREPIPFDGDDAGDASSAGDGGGDASSGTGGSSGQGGTAGAAGSAGTGPQCACTGVNDCCDGCNATNVCDSARTEPQCQAATCDPVNGCSVVSARELLPCHDNDPSTTDDRCHGGVCSGTACACSTPGECCDGCNAVNVGDSCSSSGMVDATCNASGECSGTQCECDAGPCCDGCRIRSAAFKCLAAAPAWGAPGGVRITCSATNDCSGVMTAQPMERFCDGVSALCAGRRQLFTTWIAENITECGNQGVCTNGQQADEAEDLCMPEPSHCD